MDWSFLDEIETFFSELGNFTSFINECFLSLPSIFPVALTYMFIVILVTGGLYALLKVIG